MGFLSCPLICPIAFAEICLLFLAFSVLLLYSCRENDAHCTLTAKQCLGHRKERRNSINKIIEMIKQFIKVCLLKYNYTTINSKIQSLTIRDGIETVRKRCSLITSSKSNKK